MARPLGSHRDRMLDLEPLLDRLGPDRARGLSVVFTNGCFDLLHAGHLTLLESAASQGDILVVGLNEDASVRALKGPERPFVPFDQRAALLAGLDVVDYVVGFAEPTPLALIEALRPDVLVKGADWAKGSIVGSEIVEASGGVVVRQPLLRGRSTSELVRRIRRVAGNKAQSPEG